VAASLDGYIAGPKGEFDWIGIDPDVGFSNFTKQFDTVIFGRKTYDSVRQHGGGAAMPGMRAYVFSRTLRPADCPGVTVSADPAATIAKLKSTPGKDIWLFGGGMLFGSLLELGLVDTVEVAVVPVLLGGGIPLLPQPAKIAKLRLIRHRIYEKTGTVWLEYAFA
jgi:dihydrofolate reductase